MQIQTNKMFKKINNKKARTAVFQILILLVSIIAVSYAFSSQVGEVSAVEEYPSTMTVPTSYITKTIPNHVANLQPGEGPTQALLREGITEGWDNYFVRMPSGNFKSIGELTTQEATNLPIGTKIIEPIYPGSTTVGDSALRGPDLFDTESEIPLVEIEEQKTLFQKIWNPFGERATLNSLAHGVYVGAITTVISTMISGLSTGDWDAALQAGLKAGATAGVSTAAYEIGKDALEKQLGVSSTLINTFSGILLGYSVGNFILKLFVKQDSRYVTLQCKPWKAETGGQDCDLCNDQDFPCTEYQCNSLGQNCELINKDTDEPRCIWENKNDVDPPEINPWEDALHEGYSYKPLPAERGVEIKYKQEECLPAFQAFEFGITLNEIGYCKIESQRTDNFKNMRFDFGSSIPKENHTQVMKFAGTTNLEAEGIEVSNDGNYEFYARCEDVNGNKNIDEFLFKFCIEKGPDTTQPNIVGFSLLDKTPIAFFQENEIRETDIRAYVNEPAECRWSHEDKKYGDMENNMNCADSVEDINAQLTYACSGTLTGLENREQNKFYFRCNDTFNNVNSQSKELTLIGSEPLVISLAEPNNTLIKGATDSVKVTLEAETSAGYNQGEATCYYSQTGNYDDYVKFGKTNSHEHSTNIYLDSGNYDYFIRCIDLAGNSDTKKINFDVEKDTSPPTVVRAYKENNFLKIITDEDAECVYDTLNCAYNFDDGISMTKIEKEHYTDWKKGTTFYIKCRDGFENQPNPDSCSITVKPFEV